MEQELPGSWSSIFPHGKGQLSSQDFQKVREILEDQGYKIELVRGPRGQSDEAKKKRIADWHSHDYKDQSALLAEDGYIIGLRGFTDCEGLKALRKQLNEEVNEEQEAFAKYTKLGDEMDKVTLENMATALYAIGADEISHAAILDVIIEVITEKCGA